MKMDLEDAYNIIIIIISLQQRNGRINNLEAARNFLSVAINKQENVHEARPSSPQPNLKTGLTIATPDPAKYSRTSLGSKSSIGAYNSTVTQGWKDIQHFSYNPDINKRGKVTIHLLNACRYKAKGAFTKLADA